MAPVVLMVRAPIAKVWQVVGERWSDVHRILPSLSASHMVTPGPPGHGSERECTLAEPIFGMTTIQERVLSWMPGASFTYVFDGPPWPMASISNTWDLEAIGDHTRLTLTPRLKLRGGRWTQWLAPAALWAMSRSLTSELPEVVSCIETECAQFAAVAPK